MARPTVPYVGNFRAPHSTENHVADALTDLGIDVIPIQEDDTSAWDSLGAIERLAPYEPEFALWTHTHSLAPEHGLNWVKHWRERGVSTVGYHLDRWIGLGREAALDTEPFFRQDIVVTADGGHAQEWQDRGITHVWMPPGVARAEAERVGVFRDEFDYDVVFVGSWQNYHPDDWPYRRVLIERLLERYGSRFRPFCCHYRGQDLADLYTTARVVVGDSCLAGSSNNYWSDRIPETLGRGGFLIHPDVEGLDEWYDDDTLTTYPPGDFDGLFAAIDVALHGEISRKKAAATGRALVLSRDLYEHRMADVRKLAAARGDLSDWTGPLTIGNQGVVGTFEVRRPGDGIVFEETWRQNQYGFRREEMIGRTVLDIGANVGDFSIWAALAGAEKVWAYEPDPANRAELTANLALNPRAEDAVVVAGEAVWSGTGEVWLTNEQGSVKVTDPPDALVGPERPVAARHVDEVLLRAGPSLIVKIDCEGCEYDVFAAVSDGALRRADRIVMEWHSGNGFGGDRTGDWGRMVATLAAEGHVTTMGQPKLGGMIHWRRYGT